MCDSYKPVSKYYDSLSTVYSLGEIAKCRSGFVSEISKAVRDGGVARQDVCFAGVGHGAEAISLAEEGAMVTVVEISASMLEVFQRKLNRASDETKARVNIIHGDIKNVPHRYDWVVANFFLNVFPEPAMLEMMDVLLEKCNLHGSLVIGDFYYDSERNGLVRVLQKMNWNLALTIFRIFVKNGKHPIYDYREHLSKRGWEMEEAKEFGVLGLLGINFYQSTRFTKASK